MEILPLELRKLGLNEKEVSVYLAGLELGPTSVQKIAMKAKISRPTAYVIIKNLEEKGLFSEAKQENKKYYAAQSPDSILGVLRIQKRILEEKEREFVRIIAVLKSKYLLKEKEGIKIYKGKEGLRTLEEDLSLTSCSEIFLLSSKINLKEIEKRVNLYQKIKRRSGKIEVKEIYPQELKSKSRISWLERKFLSIPNLKGTLILFDEIIFLPFQKQEGFLIKNELIVSLFKSLFLALWNLI